MYIFLQLPFFITLLFVGHFSGPLELSATGNCINTITVLLLISLFLFVCYIYGMLFPSSPPSPHLDEYEKLLAIL